MVVGAMVARLSKVHAGAGLSLTLSALSCVLGFLLLMRFLSERIASLGCTVLDLMTSEISRLRAMSSLQGEPSQLVKRSHVCRGGFRSYRLLLVALSICSSRALFAPEPDHHPIILIAAAGKIGCSLAGG